MSETTFEDTAVKLITDQEHEIVQLGARIEELEKKSETFVESLTVALRESGIDLAKALKFVNSRVNKLAVPAAAEPIPTTNQRLVPSSSGLIPPPASLRDGHAAGSLQDGMNRRALAKFGVEVEQKSHPPSA